MKCTTSTSFILECSGIPDSVSPVEYVDLAAVLTHVHPRQLANQGQGGAGQPIRNLAKGIGANCMGKKGEVAKVVIMYAVL